MLDDAVGAMIAAKDHDHESIERYRPSGSY